MIHAAPDLVQEQTEVENNPKKHHASRTDEPGRKHDAS
jgi:hypothetical protein